MSQKRELILYYRSGCSLCEEMQQELFAARQRYSFELDTVDVDKTTALVKQYGHKVPVLTTAEGEEICHYFLDHDALAGYFSGS